jgi:uncharacterized Zn finger protein (UPF0148 family)
MAKSQDSNTELTPSGRVTCPSCGSRLDVFETRSGARTVSVAVMSTIAEPKALERFLPPESGPELSCPACDATVDPAAPYRARLHALKAGIDRAQQHCKKWIDVGVYHSGCPIQSKYY